MLRAALSFCFWAAFATATNTPWNFTLPCTSPMISYTPYADGPQASEGWALWTSDSGFFNGNGGELATGDIRRTTQLSGSSFSFSFSGTAVYLYGLANATYSVSLDNHVVEGSPSDGLLFSHSDLSSGQHYITVSVTSTAHETEFAFEQAVWTTSSPEQLTKVTYNADDTSLVYNGTWDPQTASGVSYHQTNTSEASVSLTFSNARAVAATAPLNWGHWVYQVELDGTVVKPQDQDSFNASTYWFITNTTLYFVDDLDPSENHTLTLTNLGNAGYYWFSISSFDVYTAPTSESGDASVASTTSTASSTSSSSNSQEQENGGDSNQASVDNGLSVGGAVGVAIAAFCGLALIVTAIFFLVRRLRARMNRPRSGERFGQLLDDGEQSMTSRATSSRRTSPLLFGHINPLPPPEPVYSRQASPAPVLQTPAAVRQGPAVSDVLSMPPSISTEGGIRPYGGAAGRRRDDKRPKAGVAESEVAPLSPDAETSLSGPSQSEAEQRITDRVIAMIAERIDQAPGFITHQQQDDNLPPPSYAMDTSGQ